MKNLLLFLSLILLCSCNSDDGNEPFTLTNKSYKIVALEVETNMDINEDGIFSTDLLSELSQSCRDILLNDGSGTFFQEDGNAFYPWHAYAGFDVVDGVAVPQCGWLSNVIQAYRLKESTIEFIFVGDNREIDDDDPIITGTLSDDRTRFITSYNPSEMHGDSFGGDYFSEMGVLENYTEIL